MNKIIFLMSSLIIGVQCFASKPKETAADTAAKTSSSDATAKKAYAKYFAAYNECVRSKPCEYYNNAYGDNSRDHNKCLKSCEKFALAHIRHSDSTK